MATEKDRYAPIKKSHADEANKTPDQNRAVSRERPPGWTDKGGLVEQQQSAMDNLRYQHAQRSKALEQARGEAPSARDPEQRPGRSFGDLKAEQAKSIAKENEGNAAKEKKEAKPQLTFFKDRHPEHDKDRGHGR